MPVRATPIEDRLTQINSACEGSIYSFVRWDGVYKNAQSRFVYACPHHGEVQTTINRFLQGARCKKCASKRNADAMRKDPLKLADDIRAKLAGSQHSFVRWVGPYKNHFSRFEYMCAVHGLREAIYYNFLANGIQCRGCWADKKQHHRRVLQAEREAQLAAAMEGSI